MQDHYMPIPEMTINDRIRLAMTHAGDSSAALAEHLGIHRVSLHRKLSDGATWRPMELQAIAQRYDVPIGWLFGESEN